MWTYEFKAPEDFVLLKVNIQNIKIKLLGMKLFLFFSLLKR